MGVKVRGEMLLRKKLLNTGKAVNKAGADALRAGARRIRDLARDYSPVEYGNLEEAVKLDEENQSQNTWNEVVFVDKAQPAPERGGSVGNYAVYAHEGITRGQGGGIGSSPESRAKAARLGVEVGPKFLERAFREEVPKIRQEVIDASNAAIAAADEKRGRAAAVTRLLDRVRAAKSGSKGYPTPVSRPKSGKRGRGRQR